jgi:hypothetical protein
MMIRLRDVFNKLDQLQMVFLIQMGCSEEDEGIHENDLQRLHEEMQKVFEALYPKRAA